MKNIRIIFMGSSDFSVPILLGLIKKFSVIAVVTEIDKVAGRHKELVAPPTKTIAEQNNIQCLQPQSLKKDPNILNELKDLKPDLIVVAAYGKFLPKEILNLPAHGCINVHPSLLPKYRGASPIQAALLNGDNETAVSIILMDEGMDSGDILVQQKLEIEPNDDFGTLSEKLSLLASEILVKNIPLYVDGRLKLRTQDDAAATFCHEISKANGKIDWGKSATDIKNQMRAFSKWPGVYTEFNKRKLDILNAEIYQAEIEKDLAVGEVFNHENKILVKCGKDFLQLLEVRIEGKQPCDIKSFLNGYSKFIGSILV